MRTLEFSLLLPLLASQTMAQCPNPEWLSGDGVAGTNLFVACSAIWDPDGVGPITPKMVIGGRFDVAGDAVASNIAMRDLVTGEWSALGSGVPGLQIINALAVLPDGRLVAGGSFTEIGGVPANAIAAFDGESWAPLGDGLQGGDVGSDPSVGALLTLPSGELVVGGDFLIAGSEIAHGLASWDGSQWSAYGSGLAGNLGYPPVAALAVLRTGDLVVAGEFTEIDGVACSNIARWDGSDWTDMNGGMDFGVKALSVAPDGALYATGYFMNAGGAEAARVARWNSTINDPGNSWSALGNGLMTYNDEFYGFGILARPNGEIVVSGNSYIREIPPPHANGIARWNGTEWSTLAGGLRDAADNSTVGFTLLELPGGDMLVGGQFNRAGGNSGVGAANLAIWNGTGWEALSKGFNDWVAGLTPLANGDVLACGAFSTAGPGPVTGGIARWNGEDWSAVGSPGVTGFITDAIELDDGRILVVGGFWLPGEDPINDPMNGMAIYDGAGWTTEEVSTPDSYVYTIARLPNGSIAVGGIFLEVNGVSALNVAIYDGTQWYEPDLGVGVLGEVVLDLIALPNGDLIAGGFFSTAGGVAASNIARYNAASGWTAIGGGIGGVVSAMTRASNGDIVAAGDFDTPGADVARWTGSSWAALGAGLEGAAYAVAGNSNGDIVVGGQFTAAGNQPASNIARWDGSSWHALGDGVDGGYSDYSVVYSLGYRTNGELVVGGQFNRAGGSTSVNFARYGCPPCAADFNHDGNVNIFDYLAFQTAFGLDDPAADLAAPFGVLNIFDFLAFQTAFGNGC